MVVARSRFSRSSRPSSRRGGKRQRRKVVRRLTASGINRALTAVRTFRGQEIGSCLTTSTNSDFPIRMGPVIGTSIVASFANTNGQTFFGIPHLKAILAELGNATAVPATMVADPTYATETNSSANPTKFHGAWVKTQVRNCSLNPVKLVIYDVFFSQDLGPISAGYGSSIFNYLNTSIYNAYYDIMNSTDLNNTLRDSAEGVFASVTAASNILLLTSDTITPTIGKGVKEYFAIKRTHKVILAPGQSYIYTVKGFKSYTYYPREDSGDAFCKELTYFPIIKSCGELGLSSTGVPGYATTNLAVRFDYGIKAYKTNALQHQWLGQQVATMPATGTAIFGPSEDASVP